MLLVKDRSINVNYGQGNGEIEFEPQLRKCAVPLAKDQYQLKSIHKRFESEKRNCGNGEF